MLRRGDSSTNIVLFLTVLIVAGILVTWYVQTIRPTRYIIGAATEDLQEVRQHLSNACAADVYDAHYLFATSTGFFETNGTDLCIYTQVYGSCRPLPCDSIEKARFPLVQNTVMAIERNGSQVSLRT